MQNVNLMDVCQPRKSSWRRGYLGKDVQDEFMDSGPPRARRVSRGRALKHPEPPRHKGCPRAAHASTLRQGGMPARWPQGSWGQAGSARELVPGDQAPRSGWAPSSGCHICCPQVPIIPVVYSSFSSFYSCKTKLFTSGSPPPPTTHTCHMGARPPNLSPRDTRTPLLGGHSRPCPSVTGG